MVTTQTFKTKKRVFFCPFKFLADLDFNLMFIVCILVFTSGVCVLVVVVGILNQVIFVMK